MAAHMQHVVGLNSFGSPLNFSEFWIWSNMLHFININVPVQNIVKSVIKWFSRTFFVTSHFYVANTLLLHFQKCVQYLVACICANNGFHQKIKQQLQNITINISLIMKMASTHINLRLKLLENFVIRDGISG